MGQMMSQISGDTSAHNNIKTCGPDLVPFDGYFPEEVLIHILSYVDPQTLVNLRLVCQLWKKLIDKEVWKLKVSRKKFRSLKSVERKQKLPWYVYYWIWTKDPFEKNLVMNHCGQDGLAKWEILSTGGDRWTVENPPAGADLLPTAEEFEGVSSCFATSYHSCSKQQIIDLKSHGFNSKIMDEIQPHIHISDWYAGRFDCGCVYEMEAHLLDKEKKEIKVFECRESVKQWEGREWHQVKYVFQNYGPGVRYVKFYHGGMDSQFWAGHYGSKMSGACVKLVIPSTLERQNSGSGSESDIDLDKDVIL